MSLLVGCPVILPPRDEVVASWNYRPHMIVVNVEGDGGETGQAWRDTICAGRPMDSYWPRRNLGVAASWNAIFAHAADEGISHVALMSQGTVLEGGTERLAEMVDEYADWRGLLTDGAWHAIVLSVRLWQIIGPFDEIFWPAYYEDQSYVRRLELAGLHCASNPIPKVDRNQLNFVEESFAATLKAGAVDPDCYARNGELYRRMWGGDPRHETFTRPYNERSAHAPHHPS